MTERTAVISDFGGVLTTPLEASFQAFSERTGVPLSTLGMALAAQAIAQGANPLHELETGRLTEAVFLESLAAELTQQMGRTIALDGFGEQYFGELRPNDRFISYLRELRGRGLSLALCTNNVREWSGRWRAMVPVEELFDVVVDSSEVGARKPEPEIYEITLRELGIAPGAAVFVDDIADNCDGARALGMAAVRFADTDQAIADTEAALGARG